MRTPSPIRTTAYVLALTGALTIAGLPSASARPAPVTGDDRVDRLLAQMTLDEKLSMIEGQTEAASTTEYQAGYLPGVPRLGIPSLRLSDGPPGVITRQDSVGMTATMGLAATFSSRDARSNGVVIGRDAKALGQDVVLEPYVNMDRDTAFRRNFNTFGEDPLLTSGTAAAQIQGIQSQGTMAQVKHYIAYDGANNVSVDQQTLHEIYLAPFEAAVKAGVSSVMCSYNAVNGQQACDNSETLTSILRDELGFKGFVTSDWGANHSTDYLNAGLDLEMPGGAMGVPAYFSSDKLKAALANGTIQGSRVDQAVGRILTQYDRFGLLDGKSKHTVTAEPVQADEQVVLKTAQDAATLLKNDDATLPLADSALRSLALIGPGAGQTIATNGGGEKSGGLVSRQIGAYQVLQRELGSRAEGLSYAVGDDMTGTTVPASALHLVRSDGTKDPTLDFTGTHALPAGRAASWTGSLSAPQTGDYWLNIQALGATAKLTLDGTKLTVVGSGFTDAPRYGVVHPTDGNGPLPTTDGLANGRTLIHLTAGTHTLAVDATPDVSGRPVQVRLAWVTPSQQQANHDAAVAAARTAKTAVVFAWSDGDLSKPLPEGQDQLIADVAAVNPNTVVVLNTSQPVAMPWLSKVKSVLQMWYPGDQGGQATVDVLLGKVNPGGRLPFTWPASLNQELAHQADHPERSSAGVGGTLPCIAFGASTALNCPKTTYSEGVDIGYRFYAATGETPLFPFGYGLSYTSFQASDLRAHQDGNGLTVTFRLRNTGSMAGDAVPQLYLGAPQNPPAGAQFAPTALAGYDRVHLDAGQSQIVTVHIAQRQLQYWSTGANNWLTATGPRALSLSQNATMPLARTTVTVR